ncbi:peptidoglycan-binding domain-containing protein [Tessaracoccus coleopterorum]|uniref:peptidoglycan-binding domain-containing protein n=1 Tax=Tessaracoccus coleopterorum TaxID=2714950 RepID=UPI0038CD60E3
MRELQHRLLQLQWFEGKIHSDYDDATRLAVEGFQAKRGLPPPARWTRRPGTGWWT